MNFSLIQFQALSLSMGVLELVGHVLTGESKTVKQGRNVAEFDLSGSHCQQTFHVLQKP